MTPTPSFPTLPLPQPPDWLMHEIKQRLVLLLNHVLQQEPQAMQRLQRKKGQVVGMEFGKFAILLEATAAGLVDQVSTSSSTSPAMPPDLRIKVLDDNPLALAQILLRGDKPRMEISGDVMLAAEINWLVDHVRWDVEEDLSRIMGDVPAHGLMQALKPVLKGLKEVLGKFIQPPSQHQAAAEPASTESPPPA
jgi:ubiquinone biosynthesis accessory factor UbiJ